MSIIATEKVHGTLTMFLEQSVQRTASGATIQPWTVLMELQRILLFSPEILTNRDLLLRRGVLRREEPEKQLVGVVLILADGQQTSVGLADVEVHVWEGGSIDREFYYMPQSVIESGC